MTNNNTPSSSTTPNSSNTVGCPSWTEKDTVRVPVAQFLPLLTSFDDYQEKLSHIVDGEQSLNGVDETQPPATHLVQELRIGGKTNQRQNFVQFDLEFRVSVLVDYYNSCSLIPRSNNITVLDSRVQVLKWVDHHQKKNHQKLSNNNGQELQELQQEQKLLQQDEDMQVLPNYFDSRSVVDTQATTAATTSSAEQQQQASPPGPSSSNNNSNGKALGTSGGAQQEECHGRIGIVDGYHSLISRAKGLYSVRFTISVPFMSKQKRNVELSLSSESVAARTLMSNFKIQGDMQVQVEPSTYLETKVLTKSVENTNDVDGDDNGDNKDGDDDDDDDENDETIDTHETVIVECVLPSVSRFTVYWTRNETKKEQEMKDQLEEKKIEQVKEKKPLIVNVDQYALHSVGGAIVSSNVELNFQVHNGSYDTFYIAMNNHSKDVEKNIRVLRVDGRNIKKWEIKKLRNVNNNSNNNSDTASESGISIATSQASSSFISTTESSLSSQVGGLNSDQSICKVTLETGVEGSYQLKLYTEVDMDGESAKVHIPTFSCLNVNREKGFIGIEATSSVEIRELSTRGTTKLDTRELPSDMTNKASDQLVLGYKFLQSKGVSLYVDVKKHDDVAVLVAVIEEAFYEVTYSEGGHYLYHVALKVKNSSQDYIKAKFLDTDPEKMSNIQISLWSTTVDGNASRPARDKEGFILIPLKRSSSETVFSVALFYLYNNRSTVEGKGSLELLFPTFNTPITRAYYSINLPKDFNYGEFEGDLKECKYWEKPPSINSIIANEKRKLQYNAGVSNNNNNNNFQLNKNVLGNAFSPMRQQNIMPQMQQMQQQQYQPQQQMQMPMQMQQQQMAPAPQLQQQAYPRGRIGQAVTNNNYDEDEWLSDSESDGDDDDEQSEEEEEEELGQSSGAGSAKLDISSNLKSSSVVGVLPIVLNSVATGKNFKFEKLLVSETEPSIQLRVEFQQVVKSWREKRTLWRQDLAAWLTKRTILSVFSLLSLLFFLFVIVPFVRRVTGY